MITHTFTHHSNFKKYSWGFRPQLFFFLPFLFLACLLLSPHNLYAQTLHVAILDTAFCPSRLELHKNIEIATVKDLTQSHTYSCKNANLTSSFYHGHQVLEVITEDLSPEQKLIIHPYIIFNKNGVMKDRYWKRFFKESSGDGVSAVIGAIGLLSNEEERKELSLLWPNSIKVGLFASGQSDVRMSEEAKLFPQELTDELPLLLFGVFYPALGPGDKAFLPPKQLYEDNINYFLPQGQSSSELKDSSYALAKAAHLTLRHCLSSLHSKTELRKCLGKHSQAIEITNEKSIQTLIAP